MKLTVMTQRSLTEDEVAAYWRDGFVILRRWWGQNEVDIWQKTLQGDPSLRGREFIWWDMLGEDTFSNVAKAKRSVFALEHLLPKLKYGEPYHSHSKLLLKRPGAKLSFDWHQDWGYWSQDQLPDPNGILTMFVAIDANTTSNGCMQLVQGSHLRGLLKHDGEGTRVCDAETVQQVTKHGSVVNLELDPGDVAFMHSLTLHSSTKNTSSEPRRNLAVAYNTYANQPPSLGGPTSQPMFTPIDVIDDSEVAIVRFRPMLSSCNLS